MKLSVWRKLTCLGVFAAVCLALVSCRKQTAPQKIAPQASKESRLDWNLETLVGVYQHGANTDAKWDESAKSALTEFARARSDSLTPKEDWLEIVKTNSEAAMKAGCSDPMIRYMYIRYCMDQTDSPNGFCQGILRHGVGYATEFLSKRSETLRRNSGG